MNNYIMQSKKIEKTIFNMLKYIFKKRKRKVNAKVLQYWAVSNGYHK